MTDLTLIVVAVAIVVVTGLLCRWSLRRLDARPRHERWLCLRCQHVLPDEQAAAIHLALAHGTRSVAAEDDPAWGQR